MNFDPSIFLGSQGGSHALAYAFGALSSWVFANKIMVKPLRDRVEKLERKFLRLDDV